MKSKFLVLAGASAALLLTACSSNENDFESVASQPIPVNFTASLGVQQVTRAVNNAWSASDKIGIYMIKNGMDFTSANVSEKAENKAYVISSPTSANSFQPESAVETIYYPMDNSTVDFYAYYPKGTVSTNTEKMYTCALNVASQNNQEALDFLYSNNVKGKKKTDKTAALNFKHQLCKVILTVEAGDGVTAQDLSKLSVTVKDQKTTATFNLSTGLLVDIAAKNPIDFFKQQDAYIYEAILLPDASTTRTFEFNLNNGHDAPFIWVMPSALTAGNKYTYTVKLNRTGVEVQGTITDWTSGGEGTVNAN